MEDFKNGSVLESFDTGIIISKYYGYFDDVYLLFSQINTVCRSMLHNNIHIIAKIMREQKRISQLGDSYKIKLSKLVNKVPFGLFTIEYSIRDGESAKDLFTSVLKIETNQKEHILGWGDKDNLDIRKILFSDDKLAKTLQT